MNDKGFIEFKKPKFNGILDLRKNNAGDLNTQRDIVPSAEEGFVLL